MSKEKNDNSSSSGAVKINNRGSEKKETEMNLADIQEQKMLDQMEREISKLETDYTGEYRRGLHE